MAVKEGPDVKLEKSADLLVRITTTVICGFNLHLHEGHIGDETGKGLEDGNQGIVTETDTAVRSAVRNN